MPDTFTASVDVKRIKTITSYTGHARFLAECEDEIVGTIPRIPEIPSPYAYSPIWTVYRWNGMPIFIVETSHRHYEVFKVVRGPITPAVSTMVEGPGQ